MKYTLLLAACLLALPANAQDIDLDRANNACHGHIIWDPQHASGRLGWQPGWEMCQQVEDAWNAARKAKDEADQKEIVNKVLPQLQEKRP